MSDPVTKDEVYHVMKERDDELKEFFTKEFKHRDQLEELTQKRVEEIMKEFIEKVTDNKTAVKRAHARLDEADLQYVALATKIKTVQGVWGFLTTVLALALTYFGIRTGTN